jgi:hypothetical protein
MSSVTRLVVVPIASRTCLEGLREVKLNYRICLKAACLVLQTDVILGVRLLAP